MMPSMLSGKELGAPIGPARSPGLLVCGLFCGRVGECSKEYGIAY
jgi:hypothetical protein